MVKIMKKNILFVVLLSLTIISCNDWLEVTPPDDIEESELFSTGEGYRNALNGIYKNMSSASMYAKHMTWGFLDVLGNCYVQYNFKSDCFKKYASNYKYDNQDVKSILEAIWQNSYKSIANCNNLLQNIENEDPKLFEGGKLEKGVIKGEALAVRAFIHFDLLRMFAPAPVNDDGGTYIPYCDIYPSILKERETVDSCLAKIKRDLLEAKKLVGSFDTIPEHKKWLLTTVRMEGCASCDKGYFMPDDLFYLYRAFRMHYYAISATLARVYSYAGELENAYNEAEEVCNAESAGTPLFNYSPKTSEYPKLYHGVIFALNNKKITEYFKSYCEPEETLIVDYGIFTYNPKEREDIRYKLMKRQYPSFYSPLISKKYMEMDSDGQIQDINESMIPIIRRSELSYIMGEYLYSIGKTQEAIDKLQEVRVARNVVQPLPQNVSDEESYINAIIADARREFIGEGQIFYMYKKFNIEPSWNMSDKSSFVLPIPDSENINF